MTHRLSMTWIALATFVAGFVLAPPLHISFHGYAHTHGGEAHYHAAAEEGAPRTDDGRQSSERRGGREPFDPEHGKGSVIHAAASVEETAPLLALTGCSIAAPLPFFDESPRPLLLQERQARLDRGPPASA